ncbi:chemotaxis protein [bacterium]|nr:chemotaxis protein [bacterium]
MSTEILTESGTNEAEFLEFYINQKSFAINVAKVIQIISFDDELLTRTAGGPPSVMGSLLWRDHTIDLINLSQALKDGDDLSSERPVVLVTNFNDMTAGFRISGVNRIHRVNWNDIQPMDAVLDRYSPRFTGTLTIEGKNILLVDFEKLLSELFDNNEEAEINKELIRSSREAQRKDKRIVFAEDSVLIRKNLQKYLTAAGYQVNVHENGQSAWDHITRLKNSTEAGTDMAEVVDLVITDIEMPQMDGLTFCRKIKEDKRLAKIPVVIFSSLINDQMAIKCREVGADAFLSKPRTKDLIVKIDEMLLN